MHMVIVDVANVNVVREHDRTRRDGMRKPNDKGYNNSKGDLCQVGDLVMVLGQVHQSPCDPAHGNAGMTPLHRQDVWSASYFMGQHHCERCDGMSDANSMSSPKNLNGTTTSINASTSDVATNKDLGKEKFPPSFECGWQQC